MIRSFQISAVFPHMSVLENVRVALQRKSGWHYTFWRSQNLLNHLNARAMDLLASVGLERFADSPAADLSYGRKRVLELVTTIALEPELILLAHLVGDHALAGQHPPIRPIRRMGLVHVAQPFGHGARQPRSATDAQQSVDGQIPGDGRCLVHG